METKKTAVEWLEEKINLYNFEFGMASMRKYIEYAKQMEKEQIIEAHQEGWGDAYDYLKDDFSAARQADDYYDETYGSNEKN